MEMNTVTRVLLDLLQSTPDRSGRELLERVAADIGHRRPDRLIRAGADVLADLRRRDVLLGTRPDG
jgi:hypothetical protein